MKKPIITLLLLFSAACILAQNSPGSNSDPVSDPQDVLVRTNGNMFHCRIIEVSDTQVSFTLPARDTSGAVITLPRNEVYAVAYANGLTRVITPELMGQEAQIAPYSDPECGWDQFMKNLGSGAINIGIGFIDIYSPIKDADSFEDTKTMPSVFAGYTIMVNSFLKAGIHVGIGGNELFKSGVSEYDQMKVSTEIEEQFFCVGLFARYDILDGPIKPFVKGGIDFIGVNMTTTSEAESLDGSTASLKTVAHQSGIKPGLILRGGLDIYFGERFGIYGDVGTGLSLVQVGLVFNLE